MSYLCECLGSKPILQVRDVKKYFPIKSSLLKRRIGWLRAVDGVSFKLLPGELMGLVGESGCGKSTLGKTILGMWRPNAGEVIFEDQDINKISEEERRKVRKEIQYVYQDAYASLDGWWSVARLLREPLTIHKKMSRTDMDEKISEIIKAVGLRKDDIHRYPHEFSGGQQRRIGLARILTLNPKLVIFDEPTAGLDVSVQAKILRLLMSIKEMFDLTFIFISHNLSVVQMVCNNMAVMYLGKIVEIGSTNDIFNHPEHPYTRILLESIPQIGKAKIKTLQLKGEPTSAENMPSGCRFHPRCPIKMDQCDFKEPVLRQIEGDHFVACNSFVS
jgi:oligopeptide transport system ATP-binding protein